MYGADSRIPMLLLTGCPVWLETIDDRVTADVRFLMRPNFYSRISLFTLMASGLSRVECRTLLKEVGGFKLFTDTVFTSSFLVFAPLSLDFEGEGDDFVECLAELSC